MEAQRKGLCDRVDKRRRLSVARVSLLQNHRGPRSSRVSSLGRPHDELQRRQTQPATGTTLNLILPQRSAPQRRTGGGQPLGWHWRGSPAWSHQCTQWVPASGPIPARLTHSSTKMPTSSEATSSSAVREEPESLGTITRVIEAMGFTGPLKYSKWKIKIAGLRMYTCCVERIDFEEFFERCSLPDTLNSWFLVTQLHVWMCLVRLKQEGREGKYMCKFVVYSMWEDVEQRGKVMGVDPVMLKKCMRTMTENFYAAIFGYDEGILSDDTVLAAALWRNLLNREGDDPRLLAMLVEYVRKQMQYLDALNGDDLLLTGDVKWRPLVEENPQSILKAEAPAYNDAGL
ncbi:ubiquinol-cytochrome c reductase complex assembly factor 1 isoform X1 [Petromyzon marinus]|uniref:ubiquinol-cytochrome c reductase complex assembly factor 1 isoform X1 n=1 Tax=Petromyzon marinus TaxID=7757 RepID=UPI003F713350